MTTVWASEAEARAFTATDFLRTRLAQARNTCVTSSFQAEDMVVLHMVRQIESARPCHLSGDRLSLP